MVNIAIAIGLVIGSGLAHAVWNLFTKSSRNKNVFLWLIHACSCIVFLPFFIHDISRGIPLVGYGFMAVTLVCQLCYAYFLPIAYQRADMSRAYPIMRGIAALFVPLLGVWIFDEHLSPAGWAGVAAIVVGLFAISGLGGSDWRGFLHAFGPLLGVGASITAYTLNDKMLLNYISPLALILISNMGFTLMLGYTALKSGDIRSEWSRQWGRILLGSFLSPGSYLLFLLAVKLAPVSHLAPIREISTVFGTILGVWLLKESNGKRRILYAGVIVFGIVTIGIWGS
ncbi:DMT family transporter [Paenibacillus solisilvae]|uniref:DMT family transporter n=1 Tax=Paenibacillus solisilvae TaxID=2486751 RepID=A0ABW0VVL2_9BACL